MAGKVTIKKAAAPAVAPESNGDNGESRVGAMHEAFAKYVTEVKGVPVTAEQIFAMTSSRVAFRKTDEYRVGVKQAALDKKVADEEAKAEAKAVKAKEAAEAKAEREAAAAAKKEAAAKEKAEKEAIAKAAAEKAEAAKPAATTTEAKTTRKGKGKAKSETPF